jgi:hypothetical protein
VFAIQLDRHGENDLASAEEGRYAFLRTVQVGGVVSSIQIETLLQLSPARVSRPSQEGGRSEVQIARTVAVKAALPEVQAVRTVAVKAALPDVQFARTVAVRYPGCKLRGELSELQVARKAAGGEETPVGQAPEPGPVRDGGLLPAPFGTCGTSAVHLQCMSICAPHATPPSLLPGSVGWRQASGAHVGPQFRNSSHFRGHGGRAGAVPGISCGQRPHRRPEQPSHVAPPSPRPRSGGMAREETHKRVRPCWDFFWCIEGQFFFGAKFGAKSTLRSV